MRTCAWSVALLLVAGCSDQESFRGAAQMAGVYDVALVGDLVFVTSADRSELRVLDTLPDPAQNRLTADYVRAPNPLEYLAIPVLERPVSLHTDTWYDEKGEAQPGNYVFVRGSGANEISIVGAARDQLKELKRLITTGPVTAVAAHGGTSPGDESILFFAENVGGVSQLKRLRVPRPPELAAWEPKADELMTAAGAPLRFTSEDASGQPVSEQVVAMVVMPRQPGETIWELAVATRNAQDGTGRAVLLTLDAVEGTTEVAPQVPLKFPSPVRALVTHPAGRLLPPSFGGTEPTPVQPPELPPNLPAGARIFGILDEGACPSSPSGCGVIAVDAMDGALAKDRPVAKKGEISKDVTGRRMFPIRMGNTLVQGLTIGAGVPVFEGIVWLQLCGVATKADGTITFFDADGLQHMDLEGPPQVVDRSVALLKADGSQVYTEVAAREQALAELKRALSGELHPDLIHQPLGAPGSGAGAERGSTSIRLKGASNLVQVHDMVAFFKKGDGGTGSGIEPCGLAQTVTAIDVGTHTVTLSGPAPEDAACTLYSVHPPSGSILKDGVIIGREVHLTFQGELPGLTGLPLTAANAGGVADKGSPLLRLGVELAARVRVGDTLHFFDGTAGCAASVDATVETVDTQAGTATLRASIPAECTSVSVRAGVEKPWIMIGTAAGYLGRVAPGARTGPDVVSGVPYAYPLGFREEAPAVDFMFRLPGFTPERGTSLRFEVEDRYRPFEFTARGDGFDSPSSRFFLPGGVVYVKEVLAPLAVRPRIYVAYPSASGLFEFAPQEAGRAGMVVDGQMFF